MSLPVAPRRLIARLAAMAGMVGLLVLTMAGPAAASSPVAYQTQSLGNRGTNVYAIQLLLRQRGLPVPLTGIFDAATVTAVKTAETSLGLPADGIVDSRLWPLLTPRLELGATGEAVRALQKELNDKRSAHLPTDGLFGTQTRSAVLTFQRHMGLAANGIAGTVTWKYLLWHFELPAFGSGTNLCDYTVGNGAANWGTSAAIAQLEAAARVIGSKGLGRIGVGDAGFEHGGDIPGHQTHEMGMDIDIRPLRYSRDQCSGGTNWHYATYDRNATRTLIRTIRATAPGHVMLIYFNDPVLIREGLTTWFAGHDDHLHVRYCEKTFPNAMYDC
jgi:peptidoglycan hydrolase-like protein with peptidoglycan-binding domain